ncbi:uncharacterized protein [Gossypium hirsutum]|uniref:DNA/RNA polymerases superfamily protein n=1 Tax=Gossypium hirsutum TaxID=3635 RepID=A0A1U8NFE6_GOSHI|nr:uncharacterized protein LOC107947741 [Gossypium hirsutum]
MEMVWVVVVEHRTEMLVILRRGSQPALVYTARRREDGDTINVIKDLMELPFGEFDLILGMVWLVKHQVNLDCAAKPVVLKIEKGDEVVVIGEHRNYLSNVIYALKAEKLVCKGCEAYLAYISVFDFEVPSIKDIKTVKDFFDVFPHELPGLPPYYEVEFGIKLLPSIAPVSIAPYRMALKELLELKA